MIHHSKIFKVHFFDKIEKYIRSFKPRKQGFKESLSSYPSGWGLIFQVLLHADVYFEHSKFIFIKNLISAQVKPLVEADHTRFSNNDGKSIVNGLAGNAGFASSLRRGGI